MPVCRMQCGQYMGKTATYDETGGAGGEKQSLSYAYRDGVVTWGIYVYGVGSIVRLTRAHKLFGPLSHKYVLPLLIMTSPPYGVLTAVFKSAHFSVYCKSLCDPRCCVSRGLVRDSPRKLDEMPDCGWRNRFDSSKSSTYQKNGTRFASVFPQDSEVVGFIGVDTVTVFFVSHADTYLDARMTSSLRSRFG